MGPSALVQAGVRCCGMICSMVYTLLSRCVYTSLVYRFLLVFQSFKQVALYLPRIE